MKECLVSVIIPVYNVEPYIERCLHSVVNQTYGCMEILCINDCSTDASQIIVDKYAGKDKRIKCVKNKKNMGLSVARNVGLIQATGKYVLFLDSDDFLEEECVEVLVKNAELKQLDMIGYAFVTEYENDKLKSEFETTVSDGLKISVCSGKEFFKKDISSSFIHCTAWSYLYSNIFLKKNKLCFEPDIIHEDFLFYYQCMMKADKVELLSNPLYHYCIREKSIMTKEKNKAYLENELDSYAVILYRIMEQHREIKECDLHDAIMKYADIAIWNIKQIYGRLKDTYLDSVPHFRHTESEVLIPVVLINSDLYRMSSVLNEKELQFVKSCKRIIIYGKGKWAQQIERQLIQNKINDYIFMTTDELETNKNLWEHQEDVVIIIGSKKYQLEMETYLKQQKVSSYIIPMFS